MPPLTQHQSATSTKLLLIGDSGAGKSGALASLAASGYNLRILDYDNGLDLLVDYLTNPVSEYVKRDPKCLDRVRYVTLQDPMKNVAGRMQPERAGQAWTKGMALATHWKEEDGTDLGPITSWGPQDVLVLDSLSFLSRAAFNMHMAMNNGFAKPRIKNEARRDIGATQDMLRQFLDLVFDSQIRCNVVLTSHITFVAETGGTPGAEGQSYTGQGYPSAIGRALSPHIPRYFNSMLIAKTIGAGPAVRHKIYTQAQMIGGQVVNAKSSAPLRVKPEYDLAWGLAEYFQAVRSQPQ